MDLGQAARAILLGETLEDKVRLLPIGLAMRTHDKPQFIQAPGRPPALVPVPRHGVPVPPLAGFPDPAQRVRILHALANHELQAVELFAWALLAFPRAPDTFRRGCAAILREEQVHLLLYLRRVEALGGHFGMEPLSAHFWRKVPSLHTPLDFVCTLGLTFENANLDFSLEHAAAARAVGDAPTARVLERVHRDEIRHVRFAWRWLKRFSGAGDDTWETYVAHVAPPHGPDRARGKTFDRPSRRAAGLDEAFIERLATTAPTAPGGAKRK